MPPIAAQPRTHRRSELAQVRTHAAHHRSVKIVDAVSRVARSERSDAGLPLTTGKTLDRYGVSVRSQAS